MKSYIVLFVLIVAASAQRVYQDGHTHAQRGYQAYPDGHTHAQRGYQGYQGYQDAHAQRGYQDVYAQRGYQDVRAQRGYDYPDSAIPYSFKYVAEGDEGQSSHEETGDGNGRVQGSYSLQDVDGRARTVDYVADENGFRANVRTNEPGTANQNPADVTIESTAEQYQGAGAQQPQLRPQTRPVARQMYQPRVAAGSQHPGYVLVPADQARRLNYH